MSVVVRFAPSPTGGLHIGGVRTALYNYLFARKHKGRFILRIEDTDQTRFVEGAEDYIINSLKWCGIEFNEGVHLGGPCVPYRQSERKELYAGYARQLIESGAGYYAFDTPTELDEMRARLEASGIKSPQYNSITRSTMKNSLTLPQEEVQRRVDAGDPYVIRLKVPRKEEVRFHDEVRGWVVIHSSQVDDKVLMKSDGMPTYHMANVVDDHTMGITHVIRGEEWLSSTPLHVLLYRAFGWEDTMPKFAHLPLILKPEGTGKLSKRDADKFPQFPLAFTDAEGKTYKGFKELGYLPEALINFLALLGWNPGGDEEIMDLDRMTEAFSLERIGKSGTKYDLAKAEWFNQIYLRKRTDEELIEPVKIELQKEGIEIPSDEFMLRFISLMKERVTFMKDFISQGRYFFETPQVYDEAFKQSKWVPEAPVWMIEIAKQFETVENWQTSELESCLKHWVSKHELNLGKVLPAFRLAITGLGYGPVTFEVAQTIGKTETLLRLNKASEIK
jgi:glutamyl-tRNA synthetase